VAKTGVPITGDVLDWAIAESGFSRAEVAAAAGVDLVRLERWLGGQELPNLTATRKIAAKLHRQLAVFLLPTRPVSVPSNVSFRHPMGARQARELNPTERRYVRRALRLQRVQSWLASELGWERSRLEKVSLARTSEDAAADVRAQLSVSLEAQMQWPSAAAAFDAWRAAVEAIGVTVIQFSLGEESCRGFSFWDDYSPLIAVNTAWRDEARIFTLFHELGHLATRTNSACATAPMASNAGDPEERWCEAFAAAVLIPSEAVTGQGRVTDVGTLASLARRLRVSLRAAALRLITLQLATWALYDSIPGTTDAKPQGGGGSGRSRAEARADEYGRRTTDLFVTAVRNDVISESQALDYLDIPSETFEEIFASAR